MFTDSRLVAVLVAESAVVLAVFGLFAGSAELMSVF